MGIDQGEMGCDDDLLCFDGSVVGGNRIAVYGYGSGVCADVQPLRDPSGKLQRMKLPAG